MPVRPGPFPGPDECNAVVLPLLFVLLLCSHSAPKVVLSGGLVATA
jgi:hypothetical protein